LSILKDENSADKTKYLSEFYHSCNKEFADFLMRIAFDLSEANFKMAVTECENKKDFKAANRQVSKAIQYFNCYQEFLEKYSHQYESMLDYQPESESDIEDYLKKL